MYRSGEYIKNGHTQSTYKTKKEAIAAGKARAQMQWQDCTTNEIHAIEMGFEVISVIAVDAHITDTMTRGLARSMGYQPMDSSPGYSVEFVDYGTTDKIKLMKIHQSIVDTAAKGEQGKLYATIGSFFTPGGHSNDIGKTDAGSEKDSLHLVLPDATYDVPSGLKEFYTNAGKGKVKITFTKKVLDFLANHIVEGTHNGEKP